MITKTRTLAVAATVSIALLGSSACSSDDDSSDSATATSTTTMMQSPTTSAMSGTAAPAADLVGPGCAEYAATVPDGPGSVAGMAQDPVAVAASNNPMLKTLTAAVSGQLNPDVNLVDTLNGGQFTVFAPTDAAFAKLDPATVEQLETDDALLTKILTYHVVPGQLAPSDVDGTHATVEGGDVTVTGSGDDLKVNEAGVVCGGVQTSNATVYLIDSVLMPQ
ncbi:fasciclin domain-containing protein [Rhodococcus hoagii]|uniref:Fasciclin-like lipoprotein n=1 Tax=Rhodococcus hoagii (strain 103S) TaxID=685727 RepID=A0A3S5YAD3_RHOH1|nr:fasciclin domain-containing protein [Prescottella equi]NKS62200.1 fasciclin domain-containing protein [Prescottella equi]NKS73094.1 fasciclin domain-containing protein [Prescottella equi]NKS83316.1 fasciclin domain-containing protein [Prescottella equi]NKZ90029.1 fasciclin domain-containing protein [Prescottella equi]CBH49489.1 putative fasciclin-like lipoprotein [Prescottella equi 103S]